MAEIQWGMTTEDLAISIYVAKLQYKVCESIVLNLALKNAGDTPTPIVVRSAWSDYTLKVYREGFAEIPKTPYAVRKIEAASAGSRATTELMPGEVQTTSLDLDKGFDMSVPGLYKMIATRETYKKGKLDEYATVRSNELIIEIIQADDDK